MLPTIATHPFATGYVLEQQEPTYEDYKVCIPSYNRWKLEKELDFENNDIDLHLGEIADHMVDWQLLAPHLHLTEVDVSDILSVNQMQPKLQRFFDNILHIYIYIIYIKII